MAFYDVFGVGNALVDIQAQVDDGLLSQLSIDKGIMTLVEQDAQASVLSAEPARRPTAEPLCRWVRRQYDCRHRRARGSGRLHRQGGE